MTTSSGIEVWTLKDDSGGLELDGWNRGNEIYRSMIRGGNPRQVKGNNDYSQRLISDGLSMVGEVFEFMQNYFHTKCSETVLQLGIIWLVGRFEKQNTAASRSFWDDGKRATSATSMTRLTTTA